MSQSDDDNENYEQQGYQPLCDSVPSDIEDDESVLEKEKNLNIISIAEFDKKI